MKIICFIDSLGSGGAQRQMVELAKGFKKRKHHVIFLIYHDIYFYKHHLDSCDIEIKLIKENNPLKRILRIRKFIRSSKPDAVLSFLQTPNFISILSSFPFRRWRLVVGERSADPNITKSWRRRIYRWLYLFVDCVVANSHENIKMVKFINPLLSDLKCKVIYNIIDKNVWKVNNKYIPLRDNVFHLSVAASHRFLKNSKGLIEGLNLLEKDQKDRLEVSWYGRQGEDDSFQQAKALTKKYELEKTIKFFEPTSNIPDIFSYSDAIGLFSFHEGLPNTICEAITLGKPVIASKISDIPILIGNKKALLFDPSEYLEISKSLQYILSLSSSKLIKIGEENKKRSEALLNKNNIINSYLSCFTK
jgi:glycosyltransferase involved in cell wall biosynthesis